jgi:hypothetical protein
VSKKKFNQPPVYFVIEFKHRKWVLMNDQPVLRPTAVRLVAQAWKAGHLARIRNAQRAAEAA